MLYIRTTYSPCKLRFPAHSPKTFYSPLQHWEQESQKPEVCPIQQEREMIQLFSPSEVTTYKRRMTCELYTHLANGILLPPTRSPQVHVVLLIFSWGGGAAKKKQVRSLLLETQQNKWESTKKQFVKTEERQTCTPGKKGWAPPPHLVKRSLGVSHLDTWFDSRWWQSGKVMEMIK